MEASILDFINVQMRMNNGSLTQMGTNNGSLVQRENLVRVKENIQK